MTINNRDYLLTPGMSNIKTLMLVLGVLAVVSCVASALWAQEPCPTQSAISTEIFSRFNESVAKQYGNNPEGKHFKEWSKRESAMVIGHALGRLANGVKDDPQRQKGFACVQLALEQTDALELFMSIPTGLVALFSKEEYRLLQEAAHGFHDDAVKQISGVSDTSPLPNVFKEDEAEGADTTSSGPYSKRDKQVGATVMAAQGRGGVAPGQKLLEDIQYCGEKKNKDTYCFSDTPTVRFDGKETRYKWQAIVRFDREYENLSELPVPENWQKLYAGRDPQTGGNIYYKTTKLENGKQTTTIKFKQLKSSNQLDLTVKYYNQLSRERAIKHATKTWHALFAAAEKEGIFLLESLELIAQSGKMKGVSLVDGDVVQHVTNFDDPSKLTFSIQGGVDPEQQFIAIDLPDSSRELINLSSENAEVVATDSGYKIRPGDESASFTMNFEALKKQSEKISFNYEPGFAAGPTVGGKIRICDSADDCDEVELEVINWDIVVPRFNVKPRAEDSSRGKNRFNQTVTTDWWQGYILKHEIISGMEDPLLMGWAQKNQSLSVIQSAVSSARRSVKPVISAYQMNVPLVFELDFEIYQDDIPRDGKDFSLSKYWRKQREIWNDYVVESMELTLSRVDSTDWEKLRINNEILDLRGGFDSDWPSRTIRKRSPGETRLTDFAALKDVRIGGRIEQESDKGRYRIDPFRVSGVYEIRLKMKARRFDTPSADCNKPGGAVRDCKDINLAIRIPVTKQSMDTMKLQNTGQRGRL